MAEAQSVQRGGEECQVLETRPAERSADQLVHKSAAERMPAAAGQPPRSRSRSRRPARLTVIVLVIGLLVTVALAALADAVNVRNDQRLLKLQTLQAATLLEQATHTVQTPLMSAAEVAEADNGSAAQLRDYFSRYRRTQPKGGGFAAVSLWRLGSRSAQLVAPMYGAAPQPSPRLRRFVASAAGTIHLRVEGILNTAHPVIWYAATANIAQARYAVFADSALPADRTLAQRPDSPFGELHAALYLGNRVVPGQLIESDVPGGHLPGPTSRVTIPFGTTSITLVASAARRLGGALSASLWWLVVVIGALLSVAAALTAERLTRRRVAAEQLRSRVETLLAEQRDISETLQRALLPSALPDLPGTDIASRYVPGTRGTEIGGDWYEVVTLPDDRVFLVIGDVSGSGVGAAAVMASLRFAIRGFISEGHEPHAVLNAAAGLLDVRRDGHFATALCAVADLGARRLTIASAGHLPLAVVSDGVEFMRVETGPPIGARGGIAYRSTTVDLPREGMLLLYTDGLVERRDESIEDGLARLAGAAVAHRAATMDAAGNGAGGGVGAVLDRLIAVLVPSGAADDTAVVGLAWS